jgi:hypothetical protein
MWIRLPRTLLALTALLPLGAGIDGEVVTAADRTTPIELVDVPADLEVMISWSADLFASAELTLPPMRFVHHGDDVASCAGRIGKHEEVESTHVVDLCTVDANWPTQLMILHEAAHAWVDRHLTDERKQAFRELRGWTHWRNYEEAAWHENGTEQAAEIMVWGLVDRPMAMVRISGNSCAELEAGYVTLTGTAPLHGFRDKC